MNLQNKVVIIAGGASGLGSACADLLKKSGMHVAIWDKNIDVIESQPNFTAFACDVTLEEDVENALQETVSALGLPAVCINCAGVAPGRRMNGKDGPMPLSAFKQVIDINLNGTFNVMRVVAQAMMQREPGDHSERGVIINTASIAAYEGQIGQLAYSASKGGIVSMTLPAARELAQFGIRVNTIAPGLFATPLLLNMSKEVQESLASTVTFPRRLGSPSEFAELARHIIENPFINGEVIRLDGALRMQAR